MARETKVGMVAGLAFIICFAVILANRGRSTTVPGAVPLVHDHAIPSAAEPVAGLSATDTRRDSGPGTAAGRISSPQTGGGALTQVAASGAMIPEETPSARGIPASGPALATYREPSPTPRGLAVSATSQVIPPARDDDQRRRALLEEKLDALAAQTAAPDAPAQRTRPPSARGRDTASAQSGAVPRQKPAAFGNESRDVVRHTVAAGETLSGIARQYYGTRSPQVIDDLVAANRSVISDPNLIRVGVELTIPPTGGRRQIPSQGATPDAAPSEVKTAKRPSRSASSVPAFRWYQIKKNDRYISIAREQLGDETRWKEIYELNREKFPDPSRIRDGVRIKIPAESDSATPGDGA